MPGRTAVLLLVLVRIRTAALFVDRSRTAALVIEVRQLFNL